MSRIRHDHKHNADDIYDFDTLPPVPISPGATQTVTLLGPYPFRFDTPDIGNGILIGNPGDVPAGAAVFRCWIELTENIHVASGNVIVEIEVVPDSDSEDQRTVVRYQRAGDIVANHSAKLVEEPYVARTIDAVVTAIESGQLFMYLTGTGLSTGIGVVKALVAIPAS